MSDKVSFQKIDDEIFNPGFDSHNLQEFILQIHPVIIDPHHKKNKGIALPHLQKFVANAKIYTEQ